MTIQDICAQLLQHSERVRIAAKNLRGDLSIIFALQEYGVEERDMPMYRHALSDAAVHAVVLQSAQDDLQNAREEAERVVVQLEDRQEKPTKTRPLPYHALR